MISEQSKPENSAACGEDGQRRAWTDPVVTRIDIRRTMLSPGSIVDGFSGSH